MSNKPIPCPECGNAHPIIVEDKHGYSSTFYVGCLRCGAFSLPANTEADAIEYWNRGDDGPALAEDPAEVVW